MRPPLFTLSAVHLDLDFRVLGYALAVSLAVGIVFGLVPALRATRTDLACDLKERARPYRFQFGALRLGRLASGVIARRPHRRRALRAQLKERYARRPRIRAGALGHRCL